MPPIPLPVKPRIQIKPLVKVRLPAWDLDAVAKALNTDRKQAGQYFCDGRLTNWVIALHLAANGFDLEEEKKSGGNTRNSGGGHILLSKRTKARYKLRVAVKRVDLPPPSNSGMGRYYDARTVATQRLTTDGYALVFAVELAQEPPAGPMDAVYFISNGFADRMKNEGLLNLKYRSNDSEAILNYLRKELGEPAFGAAFSSKPT